MAENGSWLVVLIIILVWVLSGLIALWWLARRGYRDPRWFVYAIVFGPVFAATVSERAERTPRLLSAEGEAVDEPSRVRVLVGLDGSPAADRAVESVLRLVGPDRARLMLVRVVAFDEAESSEDEGSAAIAAVSRELAAKAERIGESVEHVVVAGSPARTLLGLADDRGVDMIALGRRGSGLSKALLGSVARTVSQHAAVPVLITRDR